MSAVELYCYLSNFILSPEIGVYRYKENHGSVHLYEEIIKNFLKNKNNLKRKLMELMQFPVKAGDRGFSKNKDYKRQNK